MKTVLFAWNLRGLSPSNAITLASDSFLFLNLILRRRAASAAFLLYYPCLQSTVLP